MRLEKRNHTSPAAYVLAPVGAVVFTLLISGLLVLWAGAPVGQTYALLFAMPMLIFGSRAVGMVMDVDSPAGPLQLLAAIFFLVLSLGPVAMFVAIRISVEN